MDQEREDYADHDLPPLRFPSAQSVGLFILIAALAVAVPVLLYVGYWFVVIDTSR